MWETYKVIDYCGRKVSISLEKESIIVNNGSQIIILRSISKYSRFTWCLDDNLLIIGIYLGNNFHIINLDTNQVRSCDYFIVDEIMNVKFNPDRTSFALFNNSTISFFDIKENNIINLASPYVRKSNANYHKITRMSWIDNDTFTCIIIDGQNHVIVSKLNGYDEYIESCRIIGNGADDLIQTFQINNNRNYRTKTIQVNTNQESMTFIRKDNKFEVDE